MLVGNWKGVAWPGGCPGVGLTDWPMREVPDPVFTTVNAPVSLVFWPTVLTSLLVRNPLVLVGVVLPVVVVVKVPPDTTEMIYVLPLSLLVVQESGLLTAGTVEFTI